MGKRQYRFWTYAEDEKLQVWLDSLDNVSSTLNEIMRKFVNGDLIEPQSQDDLKKKKLEVDIKFKEVMIKLKEKELLYVDTFDQTPSLSAKRAMKIGVENKIPETPSCFDEKNNRIMCPECGSCFVFAVNQKDIPEAKELFIDHYIQKHSLKFPDQIKKELQSF